MHTVGGYEEEETMYRHSRALHSGETGYPWLSFSLRQTWARGAMATLLVTVLSGALYLWYNRSGNNTAPDGPLGLGFALAGTLCFVLAAVLYSVQRRRRKRAIGQLNASLQWHICFALLGVVLLFMHAFGNFNPISGTYALCGLVALAISGLIGRALDRLLPRLIASEVSTMLTAQGDDRVASVSQQLEAIVVHTTQKKLRSFPLPSSAINMQGVGASASALSSKGPSATTRESTQRIPKTLHTSWDLAYISLEPTQQELDREAPHYRFIPDKRSGLTRPGALIPGAQEQMAALDELHAAMRRELVYRAIIRGWRVLHIALALLTVGLVIWHIIFALHILFPAIFHF